MKPKREICWECNRERERCIAASIVQIDDRPEIQYVCRQCWRDLDYEKYMYQHRDGSEA